MKETVVLKILQVRINLNLAPTESSWVTRDTVESTRVEGNKVPTKSNFRTLEENVPNLKISH